MADHEMLNLEEMGNLKDSMELLGEELMNGHRINPNLYVEYDVKRGLRDSAGKGVLTGLTEVTILLMDVRSRHMEDCIIRDIM